jgi:hypothetical protein
VTVRPWALGLVALALLLVAADAPEVGWTVGLGASGVAVALGQIAVAYYQFKAVQVKATQDVECERRIARIEAERDEATRRAERAEAELKRLRGHR